MATQLQRDVTATVSVNADREPEVVTVCGLSKWFDERRILDGVDLSIAPGEFVSLLGRSGSGKTTLLRVLGGLDGDYEGAVTVPDALAVVFQEPRLLPWKRVLDNVVLGLPRNGARAIGRASLEEVGLGDHAGAWPGTLSGGEAQRVALARALVRQPALLLLDEPFGALDALTRIKVHGLVNKLVARYRPAVLLVTHDVDEAVLLSDRVLVLSDGRISHDVTIDVPKPRRRSDVEFARLRAQLLAALGVVDELDVGVEDPSAP